MKKRIFSLLVFVMVIAMAAACGKEEAVETDDAKTEETADNVEDDQQEAEQPADDVDASGSGEPEREALTEEDVEALKASIKNAVVEEYIKPNGIDPASFTWPASTSEGWWYFDKLIILYQGEKFMGGAPDVEITYPDGAEKSIIDATYNGFVKWHESTGVSNENYFANSLSVMTTEWIISIDITAE